jgi:hypothetical protein
MNTKSVALWLGLGTAAAPVLPTDLSPLAVSTAEAAALAAQQPDGSERKLADLAADLAKLDARLRAVHVQLKAATSRKPPELDDRQPGGSGPFPADEFLAALAKSATDTGRTLTFEPLPKADRDRAEQQETSTVERETDQATLLDRRRTIDAEQATTWARLAWGTFTGREADRLFRFQLKKNPTADANMTAKARVLEAGVKVRRLAAKAMEEAVTSLRTLDGAPDDGPEGVSLGTVAASLAAQVGPELASFQKAAGTARDGGALTAEEAAAVADLQKQAGRLRDVLEGTAEMHGRAARAADELARFTARDRLQRDLRDTADAAARVDAGLVKLAGEWKFDVDAASPLKDATPPVVRRPEPKEQKKNEQPARDSDSGRPTTIAEIFPLQSVWQLTDGGSGTVLSVKGDSVVLEMKWSDSATRRFTLEIKGDDVKLVADEGVGRRPDGRAAAVITNLDVRGTLKDDRITLSGTRTRRVGNSDVNEPISYTLELKSRRAARGAAGADLLDSWQVGKRFNGTRTWRGKTFSQQFEITARDGSELTIASPAVTGSATVYWVVSIDGNRARLTGSYSNINRSVQGEAVDRGGSFTGDRLTFRYGDGEIDILSK